MKYMALCGGKKMEIVEHVLIKVQYHYCLNK
jgi:hypothetical protein